ncbi:uncharacterized protein TM35_000381690 [Trypanosoma theileri]|uniref:Uncharacterized protein n=1 Tax=Trypanosoma theileri TaxID=67003 RepID=A0A1X0NJZ8_9TRYP|nr:uncharacterized protein TM35_000381690 [Trypanosoma theileri]ORC85094.1 hypothetical protein TM35_000381690 [Trypanosoma theileri]
MGKNFPACGRRMVRRYLLQMARNSFNKYGFALLAKPTFPEPAVGVLVSHWNPNFLGISSTPLAPRPLCHGFCDKPMAFVGVFWLFQHFCSAPFVLGRSCSICCNNSNA